MNKQEAIKVLNTYDVNFYEYRAEEIVDAIDMAIKALSAERTGEWIYITNPIGEKICVCSECRRIKQQGYKEYCGHCGAKMTKGGDE